MAPMSKTEQCARRVGIGMFTGALVGGLIMSVVGGASVFPARGLSSAYKLRYVGQSAAQGAGMFGLFLGVGSLLGCG